MEHNSTLGGPSGYGVLLAPAGDAGHLSLKLSRAARPRRARARGCDTGCAASFSGTAVEAVRNCRRDRGGRVGTVVAALQNIVETVRSIRRLPDRNLCTRVQRSLL